MLTLAEAKDSRLNRISGLCSDSDTFLQLLNDATRELMRRGSFWGTLRVLKTCVYDNCIVWPRYVGSVLALNRCASFPPMNQWYSFDAVSPGQVHHFNSCGSHLCAPDMVTEDMNTTSVFNQIACLNDRYVRYYPMDPADVGKTITLFGVDGYGREIITTRSDGTIAPGLVLTLALPYVQTTILIRRVDRVIKQATVRPVYGYAFDGANLYPLSVYDPTETTPEYRASRIRGAWCAESCCSTPRSITAMVKLAFVPVQSNDDLVLIDNLDALALGMQSIKLSDAFDSEGAEQMMARAVHTLNLDLRDKLPVDQTVARVHYGASLRRQRVGRLM